MIQRQDKPRRISAGCRLFSFARAFARKDGRPLTLKLARCGVLRAPEKPEVIVIGVEAGDTHGPFGAKGVGEIGLVPAAAAAANALHAYDGIRRFSLAMGQQPL